MFHKLNEKSIPYSKSERETQLPQSFSRPHETTHTLTSHTTRKPHKKIHTHFIP